MTFRTALAALLVAGFAAVIFLLALSGGKPAEAEVVKITRSSDCEACHPEVYAEWKSSLHAYAWLDPFVRAKEQADNFKKKDCIPCHAPRPIFERGFRPGERVVERASNREDGVDCLSCHKLPDGGFASAQRDADGPCGPVYHPGIRSVALCAPCHNQHDTVDEWMDAPPNLKGENCNACHMPAVMRNGREGTDHTCYGGHSRDLLLSAFSLFHEVEEGRLVVRVKNDRCAHNFPTDSRHRAVDLIVTFFKKGGLPVKAADEERAYGQEPGTHRLRFRNPYRSETGMENTQIPTGEEAVLEAPIPAEVEKAVIQLIYKLQPFMLDEDGEELVHREITL